MTIDLVDYVNRLLGTPYTADFRCWDLVRKVQADLFKRDLPSVPADIVSALAIFKAFDKHEERKRWQKVDMPSHGAIVLIGGGAREHHAGVYLDLERGGVLHTEPHIGVQFEPWAHLTARAPTTNIYEIIIT